MSGITLFINQQARYRNFENVYAAIAMIGIIGLSTDMFLAWLGTVLFPWKRRARSGSRNWPWLAKLSPKSPLPPAFDAEPIKAAQAKPAAELNVAQ
jgi:NitT/TauT family transport system permease protein